MPLIYREGLEQTELLPGRAGIELCLGRGAGFKGKVKGRQLRRNSVSLGQEAGPNVVFLGDNVTAWLSQRILERSNRRGDWTQRLECKRSWMPSWEMGAGRGSLSRA